QNPARAGQVSDKPDPRGRRPGGGQGRGGEAEGTGAAVPELVWQGRAAVLRRADAAAVRPRAALDEGHRRVAVGAPEAGAAEADVRPVPRHLGGGDSLVLDVPPG